MILRLAFFSCSTQAALSHARLSLRPTASLSDALVAIYLVSFITILLLNLSFTVYFGLKGLFFYTYLFEG